jgi:tetratricopeptide (TPR) repeat protein
MRGLVLRRRRTSIAAISGAIAIAVVVASGERSAHAQSAEAEALFEDGNRLMADGKVAQACDAFEASNRVEPRAGTLIMLGVCREQNQQLASAWSAYKDALGRVRDPRKRDLAQAKANALEARLSYLTVSVADDSRVDGLTITRNGKPFDAMLWNRALPVDGGDYVIAGRAPGHEAWQTTAHVPLEGAKLSVEVPRFKELTKLIPPPTPPSAEPVRLAPAPPPSPAPIATEPRDTPASTGLFTARRKVGVAAAGAGALIAVAGVVLGQSAKQKQHDAFQRCPEPAMPCLQADQSNALISASHTRALEANIAFGVAAAAVITAGVLWFTGAPMSEPSRIGVAPTAAPGRAGLQVVGRF